MLSKTSETSQDSAVVYARVPRAVSDGIKTAARSLGISNSALVSLILRDYLESHKEDGQRILAN